MLVPEWEAYWESQPVMPALVIATILGIGISLLTSPDSLSREESLELLAKERRQMEG